MLNGPRLEAAWGALAFGGLVVARSAFAALPPVSLDRRLRDLPKCAPVSGPVTIGWSAAHVPFVEAESEADLAVGFGIVHAHLRLSQLDIMRRAAKGLLSEALGPAAITVDHLLRLMDFSRAAGASLALMPPATRDWVRGFAAGINAVIAEAPRPPDLAICGITPRPWTERDVFAVSRLASADYTWKVWRSIGALRDRADWPDVWQRLVGRAAAAGEDAPTPLGSAADVAAATATAFARNGSNALAVAPHRSASGAALLACDPHLPITTPGIWLAVGLKCPTLSAVGLTIPGVPILGVGRNAHIAWGGTNLHASSSDLVDVSGAGETVTRREVDFPVRFRRRPARVVLEESRFGPVVGGHMAFRVGGGGRKVALRWLGHAPSDEFTPFLDIARATGWTDFRDACARYSLPGLTMLCATTEGHVGRVTAVRVPRRPTTMPHDLVLSPAAAEAVWRETIGAADLPEAVDPPDGILASANEAPPVGAVPVGFFFSADDRVDRLRSLAGGVPRLSLADLSMMQVDVYQATSVMIRDRLVGLAREAGASGPALTALTVWDGQYVPQSEGALAYELVLAGLQRRLEAHLPDTLPSRSWQPLARARDLLDAADGAPPSVRIAALVAAAREADRRLRRHRSWGDVHRVRLAHPLARLPWLRRRVGAVAFAGAGGNETLQKTQHPLTTRRHHSHFGQNARFLADMSDPDATRFVLLGGQDGWLGSATMTDQVAAWQAGRTFPLPMTAEGIAEEVRHRVEITPPGGTGRPT